MLLFVNISGVMGIKIFNKGVMDQSLVSLTPNGGLAHDVAALVLDGP